MTTPTTLALRSLLLQLFIYGLLTGCTHSVTQPLATDHLQPPADFPLAYYTQAKAHGAKILNIDSRNSLITIIVHRGGALARLGHDHVVASHDVNGFVDLTAGRADLYVPLDKLTVDEPMLRASAGFATQPSQDAIEGTRQNMLAKVLESSRFPHALISVKRADADAAKLIVTITLHDTVKVFKMPAKTTNTTDGITIEGQLSFNQSDFGITPFSILGGALTVEDRLDLNYYIIADSK
jgi:hypothetical protein